VTGNIARSPLDNMYIDLPCILNEGAVELQQSRGPRATLYGRIRTRVRRS
jgi:hypothetical protein